MWFTLFFTLAALFCPSPPLLASPLERLEGGADGGGGNARWEEPAPQAELQEVLRNTKFYLLPVLYYHEEMARNGDPGDGRHIGKISFSHLRRAQQRLFLGKQSVFSVFSGLNVRIEENGPCQDLKNGHKDAAAFGADPQEVCVSSQRLGAKLTGKNLVIEVTALLAHELVHRMGGEEEEATAFQDFVRLSSLIGTTDLFRTQPEARSLALLGKAREKFDKVSSLAQKARPKDEILLCLSLEDLSSSVEALAGKKLSLGIAGFRYDAAKAVYVAGLQARQLLNYCLHNPLEEDFEWKQKIGTLPTEKIPAESLLSGKRMRETHDLGFIQRIPYRSIEVLRFNLDQLSANLEGIRRAAEAPEK